MKHLSSFSALVACVLLFCRLPSPGFSQPNQEKMYRAAAKTLLGAFHDIANTKKSILSAEQRQEITTCISRLQELEVGEIVFPAPGKEGPGIPAETRELSGLLARYRAINALLPVTTIDVVNAARFWNLDHLERMQPDRISLQDIEKLSGGGYLAKKPAFWDEARQTIEKDEK